MKKLISLLLLASQLAHAAGETRIKGGIISPGSVAVGKSTAADSKAVLDLSSTTKGMLPPRMTTTQRDNIASPTTGLTIYNTTTNQMNVYNGTSWGAVGGGAGGIYDVAQNLITNSGCESATTGWTESGGTLGRDTTTANLGGNATGVCSWDPSASSQTLAYTSVTVTSNDRLSGRNGVISCDVKTAATDLKLQVYDGTNVLTPNASTDVVTPSSSGYVRSTFNFIFPSSGAFTARFASQSNSVVAYYKDCYFGVADGFNILKINQATLYGTIKVTGCSGTHSTTSTSFASLGTKTGCTYTATGNASAPSTNVLGIKFASLPPGEYKLEAEGSFEAATQNKEAHYQFSDGTNTAREISAFLTSTGGDTWIPGINQSIAYTTAQSNVTLEIYAKTTSGGTAAVVGTNANPLVIRVYRYPTTSETAFAPNQLPASWSGTLTPTGNWAHASASFADFSAATTTTLAQRTNTNFGTVTAQSGTLPGITFTPSRQRTLLVCASGTHYVDSSATNSIRLVDGSGTVINAGVDQYFAPSGVTFPWNLCGILNVNPTSTTIKVQSKISGGATGRMNAVIDWSIAAINESMNAPAIINTVSSSSSGQERLERVIVSPSCSSSPCTIASQSGGISSVTRGSTGNYTINFVAGTFSAAPTCLGMSSNNSNVWQQLYYSAPTSSSFQFATYHDAGSSSTITDSGFMVLCMGPK